MPKWLCEAFCVGENSGSSGPNLPFLYFFQKINNAGWAQYSRWNIGDVLEKVWKNHENWQLITKTWLNQILVQKIISATADTLNFQRKITDIPQNFNPYWILRNRHLWKGYLLLHLLLNTILFLPIKNKIKSNKICNHFVFHLVYSKRIVNGAYNCSMAIIFSEC